MNEIEFANQYMREYRKKKNGEEIEAKYCPFCGGGQHHDQYTFSLNTLKHTYVCMRGKCGAKGTFKELCEMHKETADYYLEYLKEHKKEYKQKIEFTKPKYEVKEISPQIFKYFASRGIGSLTLEKAKIKAITLKGREFAVFQFFQDGQLVMNKIRLPGEPKITNGKKGLKEWKEPGGKHVLWNMDFVDLEKPVILTEGMIDALSVIEAGEDNVVSIPSGTLDLTWIENSYEFIKKVKTWILYLDNDEAGEKLSKELVSKFGSCNVKIVNHELKDANEELKTFGTDYIKNVIDKAEMPHIEGINNIADVEIIDPSKMERSLTGISVIDRFSGGYIFPSFNVWTGKRGHGKSTVVGQTLLNCVENGYNVFVYTGELSQGFFKLWLYQQAAGERNIIETTDKTTGMKIYKPKDDVNKKIDKWISGKLYTYDDDNTNEEEKILTLMEEAFKKYNCRIFLLDNLMTIQYSDIKDGFYRSQSKFALKLREFAKKNNVIINLVAHPNKTKDQDNDAIAGSGDITNAAHNVFWVTRLSEEKEVAQNLIGYDTGITIKKNRYFPYTNISGGYMFSEKSKRIYGKTGFSSKYSWEESKGYTEVQDDFCPF